MLHFLALWRVLSRTVSQLSVIRRGRFKIVKRLVPFVDKGCGVRINVPRRGSQELSIAQQNVPPTAVFKGVDANYREGR